MRKMKSLLCVLLTMIISLGSMVTVKADTEIKDIHQKYGAVDILVNAAAMFMDGSLSEPVDNFRKIMECHCSIWNTENGDGDNESTEKRIYI